MAMLYNFSTGPASLPKSVLESLQGLLSKRGEHSIWEMSPNSPEYADLYQKTCDTLRNYLKVPENYRIFFMQGTRANQYAAIPLNLLQGENKADYIISGKSSMRASIEAKRYGDISVAASSAGANFTFIPATTKESFRPDASYVHICYSNAEHGTAFPYVPDTGDLPLVADMTSCLGIDNIRISDFGLIYADTQENLGLSGMTVVIAREDLLGEPLPVTPSVFEYEQEGIPSLAPSPWLLHATRLMGEYLMAQGGLLEMATRMVKRSQMLYDYLDHQNYYVVPADKASRSGTSVVFRTQDSDLDSKFILEAEQAGLYNLKGYKGLMGMRAGIYNATPDEAVEALITFMKRFAAANPLV